MVWHMGLCTNCNTVLLLPPCRKYSTMMLLSLTPSPCSQYMHKYWTCCENDDPHKHNDLTTPGK